MAGGLASANLVPRGATLSDSASARIRANASLNNKDLLPDYPGSSGAAAANVTLATEAQPVKPLDSRNSSSASQLQQVNCAQSNELVLLPVAVAAAAPATATGPNLHPTSHTATPTTTLPNSSLKSELTQSSNEAPLSQSSAASKPISGNSSGVAKSICIPTPDDKQIASDESRKLAQNEQDPEAAGSASSKRSSLEMGAVRSAPSEPTGKSVAKSQLASSIKEFHERKHDTRSTATASSPKATQKQAQTSATNDSSNSSKSVSQQQEKATFTIEAKDNEIPIEAQSCPLKAIVSTRRKQQVSCQLAARSAGQTSASNEALEAGTNWRLADSAETKLTLNIAEKEQFEESPESVDTGASLKDFKLSKLEKWPPQPEEKKQTDLEGANLSGFLPATCTELEWSASSGTRRTQNDSNSQSRPKPQQSDSNSSSCSASFSCSPIAGSSSTTTRCNGNSKRPRDLTNSAKSPNLTPTHSPCCCSPPPPPPPASSCSRLKRTCSRDKQDCVECDATAVKWHQQQQQPSEKLKSQRDLDNSNCNSSSSDCDSDLNLNSKQTSGLNSTSRKKHHLSRKKLPATNQQTATKTSRKHHATRTQRTSSKNKQTSKNLSPAPQSGGESSANECLECARSTKQSNKAAPSCESRAHAKLTRSELVLAPTSLTTNNQTRLSRPSQAKSELGQKSLERRGSSDRSTIL